MSRRAYPSGCASVSMASNIELTISSVIPVAPYSFRRSESFAGKCCRHPAQEHRESTDRWPKSRAIFAEMEHRLRAASFWTVSRVTFVSPRSILADIGLLGNRSPCAISALGHASWLGGDPRKLRPNARLSWRSSSPASSTRLGVVLSSGGPHPGGIQVVVGGWI